ncbi:hypothetical protein [Streptomyces zaomyceticus]|uniref:hypothetical protein n=1 Tax=Streptomyces zaomyceticus TaxID=68286 RepID=UPI00367A0640
MFVDEGTNESFGYADVLRRTLLNGVEPVGVALVADEDFARLGLVDSVDVARIRSYRDVDADSGTGGEDRELPKDPAAVVLYQGSAHVLQLPLRGGRTATLSGGNAAKFLAGLGAIPKAATAQTPAFLVPVNPSELEKDPLEEPTLGLQLANTRNGWVITPPLHSFGAFGKTLTKFHTARHGIKPWINYMPEPSDDYMFHKGMEVGLAQLHLGAHLAQPESPKVLMKRVRNWLRLLNRIGPDFSDAQALMAVEVLRLGMIIDRMRVADPLGDERDLAPITTVEFERLLKAFVDGRPQLGGATPEAQQAGFFKEAEEAGSRDPSLGMSSFLAGSHLKPEQAWLFEPAPVPPRPRSEATEPTEVLRVIGGMNGVNLDVVEGRLLALRVLSTLTAPVEPLGVTSRLLGSWVDREVLEWWAATVLPDMTADTGGRHLRQLLDLVTRASRAGRVGSLAQIVAFALEEAGVYKRTPGTSVNGHAVVRDFTGRVNGPLKTDQSWLWAEHESGRLSLESEVPLGWVPTPWSSAASQGSQPSRVYMAVVDRGVKDRFRTLGMDHGVAVLVELMLRDEALLNLIRTGLDAVVVVGPYVGAGDRPFQRILAAAVGELVHAAHGAKASEALTAYACDGPMLIARGPEAGALVLIDRRARGQQRSRWVPAKAADAFPTGYADMEVRTATGRLLKASELAFHPILTADGTDVSGTFNASDALRRKNFTNVYGDGWGKTDTYTDYYFDSEGLDYDRGQHKLPYPPIWRLTVHSGYAADDIYGKRHILENLDKVIGRRPSFKRLRKAAGSDDTGVLHLHSCHGAITKGPADPLLVDAPAVGYATTLNTRVLAAEVVTTTFDGGAVAKLEDADPRVPASKWQLVYPLPTHDHLKELVARSGLGDVVGANDVRLLRGGLGVREEGLSPAEVRMLRWIRALRLALRQHDFGAFGDFGSLQEYLPGIVAMEKLRLSETEEKARQPLEGPQLVDMVGRYGQTYLPSDPSLPKGEVMRKMLGSAERHIAREGGGGTLSEFLEGRGFRYYSYGVGPRDEILDAESRTDSTRVEEVVALETEPFPEIRLKGFTLAGPDPEPTAETALSLFLRRNDAVAVPAGTREQDLDIRRPPRLDWTLPPPAAPDSPNLRRVTFADGTRLPLFVDGLAELLPELPRDVLARSRAFGQHTFLLRGVDDLVRPAIMGLLGSNRAVRPGKSTSGAGAALPNNISAALGGDLNQLVGDGALIAYQSADGQPLTLRLTVRHYGRWERFARPPGEKVQMHSQNQASVSTGRFLGASERHAVGLTSALWPLAAKLHVFARLGAFLESGISVGYNLGVGHGNLHRKESTDGSHIHLDDVYYFVEVTAGKGRGSTVLLTRGFAVRGGLLLKLPDSATKSASAPAAPTGVGPSSSLSTSPAGLPSGIPFGSRANARTSSTEAFGPMSAVLEWAVAAIGAEPGGTAEGELRDFFSSGSFQGFARILAAGRLLSPQLYAEDAEHTPLGFFEVRMTTKSAQPLDSTAAAKILDMGVNTAHSSRSRSTESTRILFGAFGPALRWFNLGTSGFSLRLLLGLNATYARDTSRTAHMGGSGGSFTAGYATSTETPYYLFDRELTVILHGRNLTGEADTFSNYQSAKNFRTWTLDSIDRQEARRLAGWETDTVSRRDTGDPDLQSPAIILATDRPRLLGGSRVEEIVHEERPSGPNASPSWADELANRVLAEAARLYPDLVAPLDEISPHRPGWSRDQYDLVFKNSQRVLRLLSHDQLDASIKAMTTTGLRIDLRFKSGTQTGWRHLWLDAELTGRRYEGPDGPPIMAGWSGSETMAGGFSDGQGGRGGGEIFFSYLDAATNKLGSPLHTPSTFLGAAIGGRTDQSNSFGPSVAHDAYIIGEKPSERVSYRIAVKLSHGGFTRMRGIFRGLLSLGILGTQRFVFVSPTMPVSDQPLMTGRAYLAVPSEYVYGTPLKAPASDRTPEPQAQTFKLTSQETQWLLDRTTPPVLEGSGHVLLQHPYTTADVVGDPAITDAVEAVLREASGGSWHFTVPGAPAHDAAVRPFQQPYLAANIDQTSAPGGWAIQGLWAAGPYRHRHGSLTHQTRVTGLRYVSGPHRHMNSIAAGGSFRAGGEESRSSSYVIGGRVSLFKAHDFGKDESNSFYALEAFPLMKSSTLGKELTLQATSEIQRHDLGHQVMVVGDTEHLIAARSSPFSRYMDGSTGMLGSALSAGRKVHVPDGWIGHLPERTAAELRVTGTMLPIPPQYNAHRWLPDRWIIDHPFGGYPVNTLETSQAQLAFGQVLAGLGVDLALRDTVMRTISSRGVRGLRHALRSGHILVPARGRALSSDGVPAPESRQRRSRYTEAFAFGDKSLEVTLEMIAGEPQFEGLGVGVLFEDTLKAKISQSEFSSVTKGSQFGLIQAHYVHTGVDGVPAAGPVSRQDALRTRTVESHSSVSPSISYVLESREPYAKLATSYHLRMTVRVISDDPSTSRQSVTESEPDVLREHVPISLLRPVPPMDVSDEGPTHAVLPGGEPRTLPGDVSLGEWKNILHPDGTTGPFKMPEDGFHVRQVIGAQNVQKAALLALKLGQGDPWPSVPAAPAPLADEAAQAMTRSATASVITEAVFAAAGRLNAVAAWASAAVEAAGASLRALAARLRGSLRARANLTAQGAGPAQTLHDATANSMLSAFFGHAADEGYPVPGLSTHTFLGGAEGQLALHAKPDLSKAKLVSVSPAMSQYVKGSRSARADDMHQAHSVSHGAGTHTMLGGGMFGATPAGTAITNAMMPVMDVTGSESPEHATSHRLLPYEFGTRRSFLFHIPATWLVRAKVRYRIMSSAVGRGIGRALGFAERAPGYVEAETTLAVWVREDVARSLGLINEQNFPEPVRNAWDAVEAASTALSEADEAYLALWRTEGLAVEQTVSAAERELESAAQALRRAQGDSETDAAVHEVGGVGTATDVGAAESLVVQRTDEHEAAKGRLSALIGRLDELRITAENAAEELHRVRTATDRLTQWHQRAAVDGTRTDDPEPPHVVAAPPAPAQGIKATVSGPEDGDAARQYRHEAQEDGTTSLVSPVGTKLVLSDTPTEGSSFFHALDAGLRRFAPEGPDHQLLPGIMIDALENPANADLIATVVPGNTDTFTTEEPQEAGVTPTTASPQGHASVEKGTQSDTVQLDAAQRIALARTQILRFSQDQAPNAPDHGADFLPPLAARTLGVRLHIVRDDGTFVEFTPDGAPADASRNRSAPLVVLYLRDRKYQLAAPARSGREVVRPAYLNPPWVGNTLSSAGREKHYDAAGDHRTLVGPGGEVLDLITPSGDGNRFYAALAEALPSNRRANAEAKARSAARLAYIVADLPLTSAARPDPHATYTPAELEEIQADPETAFSPDRIGIIREAMERDGGHLPLDALELPARADMLLRIQLRAARDWDRGTTKIAAAMAATVSGRPITLVQEDGTADMYGTHLTERPIVLYQRGGEFLSALPRSAAVTKTAEEAKAPPPSEALAGERAQDWQISNGNTLSFRGRSYTVTAVATERLIDAIAHVMRFVAPAGPGGPESTPSGVDDQITAVNAMLRQPSEGLERGEDVGTEAERPADGVDLGLRDPFSLEELRDAGLQLSPGRLLELTLTGGALTREGRLLTAEESFLLLARRARAEAPQATDVQVTRLIAEGLSVGLALFSRTRDIRFVAEGARERPAVLLLSDGSHYRVAVAWPEGAGVPTE